MSALSKAIGARLRELRVDAELSQAEIARRMGSYRSIVCRTERGIMTLTLEVLQAHARALELDLMTVLAPLDIDALHASDSKAGE